MNVDPYRSPAAGGTRRSEPWISTTEIVILAVLAVTLAAMAWLFWYAELWEFGKLFHLYEGLGPSQDYSPP